MTGVDRGVTDVVRSSFNQMEDHMGANQFTENSVSHLEVPATSGVYMITDIKTGDRYIGSSINIRRRAMQHFAELKKPRRNQIAYRAFQDTFDERGPRGFEVTVLILCSAENLLMYEAQCIAALGDTINKYKTSGSTPAYTLEECRKKSERTKKLWASPEYRARAVAARIGKSYSKGYKCTPEQIENRKKAGRISNMKRIHGDAWKMEYAKRYPEHVGDISGY